MIQSSSSPCSLWKVKDVWFIMTCLTSHFIELNLMWIRLNCYHQYLTCQLLLFCFNLFPLFFVVVVVVGVFVNWLYIEQWLFVLHEIDALSPRHEAACLHVRANTQIAITEQRRASICHWQFDNQNGTCEWISRSSFCWRIT